MKIGLLNFIPVFFTILLLLTTACAKAAVVPSEEESKGAIVIGILEDLSGPVANQGVPYVDGEKDCIRFINEERGGILGHPLQYIIVDHKMDSTLAISGWNRLKDEGAPLVMGVTSAAAAVLHPMPDRDHIPLVSTGGSMDQMFPKEPSFYFGTTPEVTGLVESMLRMVEKEWAAKGESRTPRIGFDVLSFGTYPKIWGKAMRLYAGKRGWEYITTNTGLAPVDVTTQVLQMKQFGPDHIHFAGTGPGMIAWLKELDRQSLHPTLSGLSGMGSQEIWDAVGEICVGARSPQYSAQWADTDIHLVQKIHELNAMWNQDVEWKPGSYVRAFADFLVVAEALERAIEKVGYENLNGEAMKEAMETIRDFDPMGLGTSYTWTPNDHQGVHACKWYEWTKDGTQKSVSDWYVYEPLPEERRTNAWWLQD